MFLSAVINCRSCRVGRRLTPLRVRARPAAGRTALSLSGYCPGRPHNSAQGASCAAARCARFARALPRQQAPHPVACPGASCCGSHCAFLIGVLSWTSAQFGAKRLLCCCTVRSLRSRLAASAGASPRCVSGRFSLGRLKASLSRALPSISRKALPLTCQEVQTPWTPIVGAARLLSFSFFLSTTA